MSLLAVLTGRREQRFTKTTAGIRFDKAGPDNIRPLGLRKTVVHKVVPAA